MNTDLDRFFNKPTPWQQHYNKLRKIVLSCGLSEELKWGHPCYTFQMGNVVLIHGFKEYCALLFMKGALLKDPKNILIQQTANVQSARQIRFTTTEEISQLKPALITYITEAIKLEKTGEKVEFKKTKEYSIPPEWQTVLKEIPEVKKAFYKLTPGRQRGYLLHFSSAKQSKTREARIEKCLDKILAGKGLDDE